MSDAWSFRQAPTGARLIANGDGILALEWVDRIDVNLERLGKDEAVDALRFWIGRDVILRSKIQSIIHGTAIKYPESLNKDDHEKLRVWILDALRKAIQ